MASASAQHARVLSGMRPTGRLHLGHYHGVLKNWLELQHEYECFFFVADWHALTTHYEDPSIIPESTRELVIDWLAAGINPGSATIFVQSRVPEHAELHLLLSMITPLGWLERVPTYKDQQERLKERDLATYGFLGYPLLQSADILVYKAGQVPVGEDQVAHVELTREVARRFNHLYGREPGFEDKAEEAKRKMGKKNAKLFDSLKRRYQEQGDQEALEVARALVEGQGNITLSDRERLLGYLEGGGRVILPEPQPLLTKASKMPGLDGQKMSKSYRNTISLRDTPAEVEKALRTMPTDPARVRRTDPGEPEKCPVWQFHQVYSNEQVRDWVQQGCRSAGIGCLECKQPIVDGVLAELMPIQARALEYEAQPELVRSVLNEGCEKARDVARETLEEVRHAMSLVMA
ncbi:tryptophan--tRNA ligase [Thiocystis violascens]|uniref:Tryptophan--tRNA ligase n=1 Tax=Thiocystis violascens (strain ATCC 17096 / DSM 198 / 6111) TaxID=765911 RepID=I3Y861_THIV6|nr:tryptophan--tRNA ligase [Thiocystis violascens]AFL73179.1 tryptophanyl-tRNA synthetase [Thiocystis violascens DSM 198]